MKRAIILIVVLSIIGFGGGAWMDKVQSDTAESYQGNVSLIRQWMKQGDTEKAAIEQARLYAKWEGDVKWLNCITSHHHTRAVSQALLELSTAFEFGWEDEIYRALDQARDALTDVGSGDRLTIENVL
ncbi:MAG: DUF4363 family protein [Clostridiales bacterium]|nr:DUF4363 family protein [Clostridiales bacterium]